MLLKVKIGSASVCLLNTHLESTKDFGNERVFQLNQVFDRISAIPSSESVIFAGDLNIRDKEVSYKLLLFGTDLNFQPSKGFSDQRPTQRCLRCLGENGRSKRAPIHMGYVAQ